MCAAIHAEPIALPHRVSRGGLQECIHPTVWADFAYFVCEARGDLRVRVAAPINVREHAGGGRISALGCLTYDIDRAPGSLDCSDHPPSRIRADTAWPR